MKTLITRIKRLALALCFVTPLVSWAAEPVAVWDGDFSSAELTKYSSAGITLVDWQQTHGGINHGTNPASDYSSITIDRNNQGVFLDFASARGTVTVLVKYSGIPATPSKKSTLIATTANSNGNYNRCGIRLQTDGKVIGLWNGQTTSNNDADYGSASSDALPSSGTLAFVYDSGTSGITVYAASGTDALGDTALWNNTSLKAGNIYGMAIGGSCRNSNSAATTGMTISGLAVFSSVLSVSDMNAYVWPSEIETITISGNTTVSDINTQVAAVTDAKEVIVSLDADATVDVDVAFAAASIPYSIASEGTVTLSAESQPDASYFTNADFSGVKGAVKRSWLTNPGVVGFNFRNNSGGDTSGALATGTWYNDGGNVANGTSTAMFGDGVSTLTWASANTWASGSGSILSGYLDDGSMNGNGAEVTLTGVPYDEYDVIIYCNSDSNPGYFLAKTVNGTTYTWDSDAGAVVEGSGTWGKAALAIPVYGVNALRIKNLTGPLTIYGTPRSGINRGGIAAIQIMPPDTPDNIRTYTLTLDGTDTTWSAGTWTLEGNTVDAPTAGNVKIVASASTTVTVDSAVSLATLTVENSTDAVVSLVPGTEGSISTINATVKSGVLKQCAANLVAVTLTVEDGGTFDFGGFAPQANVRIAGDGDGNYPWALTSTGDAPLGNWISLVLDADATIGGTGKITFGKSNAAGTINYNGHTLTKTGSGEFVLNNGRTATGGTGTLDIVGGKVTTSEYTCIDGFETIYAHTAVIVRNGAELANGTTRRVWVDKLTVESGATVTTTGADITTGADNYFGVTTALVTEGALTTTKLQFNDDATVTLGGDLTLTDFVAKGDNENTTVGDVALVLADGTASATVTVSGTVDAVGTVSVGSGITPVFSGTSDVTATLSYAADPSPTANTALAFTQQSNWKGTVVLDYAITGASGGSIFQPGKYGNANSTVCLAKGASNIYFGVRDSANPGNINTKLYLKGDVSIKNGWGGTDQPTTFPQLGADEGVTFTTRPDTGPNKKTYFVVTALKDFAGTIIVSTQSELEIENVVLDALPANGALVVKATQDGTGVISGSVTVGNETVQLVFDTVNDVSGLYRPSTVDITIPTVDNATVAVTVGGVAVTPENGVVTVEVGSAVVVTYTAAEGYTIANGTIEFTADANTTTVDTTSVTVSEYIAWIYDANGVQVGNPYTTIMDAMQAFNTTGNSIRFKTSIESDYAFVHATLLNDCNYDSETFTYTRKPSVAKVTSGMQEYLFTSLVDAVTKAISGDTVTLLANVDVSDEGVTFPASTTLTLDLNNCTITAANTATGHIQVNGALTITDNSEGAAGKIVSGTSGTYGVVQVAENNTQEGAALTIAGGTIEAYFPDTLNDDNQHPAYGVTIKGKGTVFNMTGGKVKAGLMAVMGHGSKASAGTYTISGGTIESVDDFAMYLPTKGGCTVTISGGTFTGAGAIGVRAGTLSITGGTFTASGTGIAPGASAGTTGLSFAALATWPNYGDVTVTVFGGSFTSASDVAAVMATTSTYTGTISLTGGIYSTDVSDYCATGYEATEDSGVWTVAALPNYTVTFDADGGTPAPAAQTVQKGSTATAPTAPTKENYTFAGWTLGGEAYDFATPVTGNITLVASWTAVSSGIDPTKDGSSQTVTPTQEQITEAGGSAEDAAIALAIVTVPTGVSVDAATYKGYFKFTATEGANGAYDVEIAGFADEVVQTVDASALTQVLAAQSSATEVTVVVKPGLCYGFAVGSSLSDVGGEPATTLVNSDSVTVDKPAAGNTGFIKVRVSTTPLAAETL